MPIVNRGPLPITALASGSLPEPSPASDPSTAAIWSAEYQSQNSIVSGIRGMLNFGGIANAPVDGDNSWINYNPWHDIKGTKYEQHWDAFAESRTPAYTAALKTHFDREDANRATVAEGGWTGWLASLAATITDPTVWVPVGGEAALAGRGVWRVGKGAMATARAAAIGTTAQEVALHASQFERTGEESAWNIGTATMLGAVLGGGTAALLSHAETRAAGDALERLHTASVQGDGGLSSAPAPKLSIDDLSVSGRAAAWIAEKTQNLSPKLRLNFSPSVEARRIGQELYGSNLFQEGHAEGLTVGPSVSTLARVDAEGRPASALIAINDIYNEMRKSGTNMGKQDFYSAIGEAMRRGDRGENDFISRAATTARRHVFDPYFNEGKEAGIYEAGDDTAFAESYFPRQYRRRVMIAREHSIVDEWQGHFEQRLQNQFAEAKAKLDDKLAEHDQALNDLTLPPKKRAVRIEQIKAEADALDAANAPHVDRISSINDLRSKARAADTAGDSAEAEALREEARKLYTEGGDDLRKYLKARRTLRVRDARLSDSPANKAARTSRSEKLSAKRAAAVEKFRERWGPQSGWDFEKPGAFGSAARDIAQEAFDTITGRNHGDGRMLPPDYMTPLVRGPLRERTLPIPDEVLSRQGILESNVSDVMRRYARTAGGDIELARKFGSATMTDQLKALAENYHALRRGVTDEKTLRHIDARQTQDTNDLLAGRDMVRGTYKALENASTFGRTVRGLNQFNFIRKLGGVVISSFSDAMRPGMVHGLAPYMSEGIRPLLTNLKAVKLSAAEAHAAGVGVEGVIANRIHTMAGIADPMERGAPIERMLESMSHVGSKWSGINAWTDGFKDIMAMMSQNRILNGSADTRTLAFLGIDGDMATRIKTQFEKHGQVEDGVHIANTQAWEDPQAVRYFRAAVNKDTQSGIVTPEQGDLPLFASTPLGRVLLQFQSFTLAAHQKVLLRGLQENKANFVTGLVGMTALGLLSTYLRAWRGGSDRLEKFHAAASNPGYLLGESLDNSGIFTLGFDFSNTVEKVTSDGIGPQFSFNPIKTPLIHAGRVINPNASMQGSSQRFATRGVAGALLGPTFGTVFDEVPAAVQYGVAEATGQKPTLKQRNAVTALLPFNSFLGFKEGLQALNGDSPYTAQPGAPDGR